jgi:hypothetical protein
MSSTTRSKVVNVADHHSDDEDRSPAPRRTHMNWPMKMVFPPLKHPPRADNAGGDSERVAVTPPDFWSGSRKPKWTLRRALWRSQARLPESANSGGDSGNGTLGGR